MTKDEKKQVKHVINITKDLLDFIADSMPKSRLRMSIELEILEIINGLKEIT